MKPSELQEDQEIVLTRKNVRIRFIRSYTMLTTWVGTTDDHQYEHEIQITAGDGTDAEIDAQFRQIIADNDVSDNPINIRFVCN